MDNEARPEHIAEQGAYYPDAPNYYSYYCTGFEPPGEWDDRYGFFYVDGLDSQYTGVQTEAVPYVYYPPYGYADSLYSPYNPCVPGALQGVDASFLGTQQFYAAPSYQIPASSSGYYSFFVQPVPPAASHPSAVPALQNTNTFVAGAHASMDPRYQPPVVVKAGNPPRSASNDTSKPAPATTSPLGCTLVGPQAGIPNKIPVISDNTASTSASAHVTQARTSSSTVQPQHYYTYNRVIPLHDPAKHNVAGSTDFGPTSRGWSASDMPRNCGQDVLGEQNRGPRINRMKPKWTLSNPPKTYITRAGYGDAQGNIIICTSQYNRDDFPINYPNAKFFVIKSYSEDDVHKSIKYAVWSSTPAGNRKLHTAYEDAQKISSGNPANCPVFLFFSVNASGQFCGVAEMTGPVDFAKDMEFWQQDKWTGSFPVKWHIVKDVPNSNFRHVLLENNEFKPVTNSRDTQEVNFLPGMQMLKIFKNYMSRTSIFDDFMHYEERQKSLHEDKLRYRGYEVPYFLPITTNNSRGSVSQPSNGTGLSKMVETSSVCRAASSSDLTILARGTGDAKDIEHLNRNETIAKDDHKTESTCLLKNVQSITLSGDTTIKKDEMNQGKKVTLSSDQVASPPVSKPCLVHLKENNFAVNTSEKANTNKEMKCEGVQLQKHVVQVQVSSGKETKQLKENESSNKGDFTRGKNIPNKSNEMENTGNLRNKSGVMEVAHTTTESSSDENNQNVRSSLEDTSEPPHDLLTVGSVQFRVPELWDSSEVQKDSTSSENKPEKTS